MDVRKKLGSPDKPVNARDRSATTDKSKAELAVKIMPQLAKFRSRGRTQGKAYLVTREGLKGTTKGELGDGFTEDELERALQKM